MCSIYRNVLNIYIYIYGNLLLTAVLLVYLVSVTSPKGLRRPCPSHKEATDRPQTWSWRGVSHPMTTRLELGALAESLECLPKLEGFSLCYCKYLGPCLQKSEARPSNCHGHMLCQNLPLGGLVSVLHIGCPEHLSVSRTFHSDLIIYVLSETDLTLTRKGPILYLS